jgi:hypothetical protein
MDTPLQPSFIPKKPIDGGPRSTRSSGGIFYFVGATIFTVAIIASLAVFGYEYYLGGRIAKMEADLTAARAALQPELIKELSRSNKRFLAADEILKTHVTVSAFFNVLQKLTLQSVRFNTFAYDMKTEGIAVVMKGEAKSYAIVAQQAKVISEDPAFNSVQFSDLDLNTKGNVTFVMKATVNPKAVSYVVGMESMLSPQANTVTPVNTPSASTTQVSTTSTQTQP